MSNDSVDQGPSAPYPLAFLMHGRGIKRVHLTLYAETTDDFERLGSRIRSSVPSAEVYASLTGGRAFIVWTQDGIDCELVSPELIPPVRTLDLEMAALVDRLKSVEFGVAA